LTGAITADTNVRQRRFFRNVVPRFTRRGAQGERRFVERLGEIAARKGATTRPNRDCLGAGAEALDRADPGTTKLGRLDENLGAASVELTTADLRDIEGELANINVQGDRYPPNLAQLVGR